MIKKKSARGYKLKTQEGFSLLEVTVVIGIMAVLSGLMLGFNRSSEKQIVLYRDEAVIVGVINRAKSLALEKFKGQNACAFGVYFNKTDKQFILFEDLLLDAARGCKGTGDIYLENKTYNAPNEALTSEKAIFPLDNRLKFEFLDNQKNDAGNTVTILFVPPELTGEAIPALPVTIKLKTIDNALCSELEISAGGQITERNCS